MRVTNFCHMFGRGNGGRLICGTAYTRVYTAVLRLHAHQVTGIVLAVSVHVSVYLSKKCKLPEIYVTWWAIMASGSDVSEANSLRYLSPEA